MENTREFLLALVGLLLLVSVALVLPYVEYVLLAAILAYGLYPVQRRLLDRVSSRTAAAVLSVAATVAVVIPLVAVTRAVSSDAAAMISGVREGELTFDELETAIADATGVQVNLDALFQAAVQDLGGGGGIDGLLGVFGVLTHVIVGLGLTIFLLFYFLKNGDDFLDWLHEVLPVEPEVQDDLFSEIDGITRAVLLGHILVALIQGVIAGLGLLVVGIPNALFWTAIMVVLSLLPVVGSFLVWGPAAVYLFITGDVGLGAFLFVYGTIVVGISDDYLRPVVVDRYAEVNPAVVILGVLGGLSTIGFIGIFVGPIIIGALRATLDVYEKHYGTEP